MEMAWRSPGGGVETAKQKVLTRGTLDRDLDRDLGRELRTGIQDRDPEAQTEPRHGRPRRPNEV